MRAIFKSIIAASMIAVGSMAANAQYYQLANQATNMLQTALSGDANYRGFVDVSYVNGIGNKQANFLELSTTQGIKYNSWFFMGVGAGIDVMFSEVNANSYRPQHEGGYTQTKAMVPLFTDFRFNFGSPSKTGAFVDCKIGAAFYISNNYILVGDGYINSSESFYLKPSIGVRIPVSSTNSKYAFNVSASYQLLTNSYWYAPNGNNSITLNAFGVTAGFEW